MKMVTKRNAERRTQVKSQVGHIEDLIAADGNYDDNCAKRCFKTDVTHSSGGQPNRMPICTQEHSEEPQWILSKDRHDTERPVGKPWEFSLINIFVGAMEYIMEGSGLQDFFSIITKRMMTGHSSSKALRGHLLAHSALAQTILSKIDLTEKEHSAQTDILNDVDTENSNVDAPLVTKVGNNGGTARLPEIRARQGSNSKTKHHNKLETRTNTLLHLLLKLYAASEEDLNELGQQTSHMVDRGLVNGKDLCNVSANSTETNTTPSASTNLREILNDVVVEEASCGGDSEMDYKDFDNTDADPDFRPNDNVQNEVEIHNNNLETDNLDNKAITTINRRGRTPRQNKTRERARHNESYQRNKVKEARVYSESHRNYKNVLIPARRPAPCHCKSKCTEKLLDVEKEDIFKNFYNIPTKNEQDVFLQGSIVCKEIKRRRARKDGAQSRTNSFSYNLLVGSDRREVCRDAFFGLHENKRGKQRSGIALKPSEVMSVMEHISLFLTKQTHYGTREHNYLDAELNVKIMHSLFLKKHPKSKVPQLDVRNDCKTLSLKLKNKSLNDTAKSVAAAKLLVIKRRSKKFYNALKASKELYRTQDNIAAISRDSDKGVIVGKDFIEGAITNSFPLLLPGVITTEVPVDLAIPNGKGPISTKKIDYIKKSYTFVDGNTETQNFWKES
ncbi:hypothetical protein ILUMI_11155 [Ignelater luminosus]|uniref:Uncharacterized protein n=1 Tax=Ignelater luminosus TaxID=2038154 RepID=A0A8K0G803_IGNLU|nr:hypothetical protein ILUMI_11155 [Ignelater luminosus]